MTRALVLLLMVSVASLCACAGAVRPDPDPALRADTPPEDFWLSVTVVGPVRAGPGDYAALARPLRPARYIVEADRILRAALGPGAKEDFFPPQTRQLSAAQMAELWRLTRDAGLTTLTQPASAAQAIDARLQEGKTLYVITTHAAGQRNALVIEVDPAWEIGRAGSSRLVDRLAAMAWVPEKS